MSSQYRRRRGSGLLVFARFLVIVEAAGVALMCLVLNNILPIKYLGIIIAVAVLILALQIVLVAGSRRAVARGLVSILFSLVLIALSVAVVFFIKQTESKLHQLTEASKTQTTVKVVSAMNVYVRKTDGYYDISELQGKTIGALDMMDSENVSTALQEMNNLVGGLAAEKKYIGIMPLINSLRNSETDAIIINSGYENAITDNDSGFNEWAELLCTLDVTRETRAEAPSDIEKPGIEGGTASTQIAPSTAVQPVEDLTIQPSLIYLTGMDTRGDMIVSEVGNSDVNMVMAVNPQTRKILLINIPRDYYYYLWGDVNYPDKITHSGYYGVDCSIQTMNSLFDININYYVKVGFNSVINIVNAIGGINVYSDYEFELEGYYFPAGENYLDGMAALQFSRERESLPGGDRARGMNQQKVISAVIDKATSPEVIGNFGEILGAISSNVVTNISVEDIEAVVKMQLEDGASWDIESIQVDGTGMWDYCYSLGDANDVMAPDWSTVDNARARIYEVLSGQ